MRDNAYLGGTSPKRKTTRAEEFAKLDRLPRELRLIILYAPDKASAASLFDVWQRGLSVEEILTRVRRHFARHHPTWRPHRGDPPELHALLEPFGLNLDCLREFDL